MRRPITIATTAVLFLLGLWHLWQGSTFIVDVVISLFGFWLFTRWYSATDQDLVSLSAVSGWLVLHNLGLYDRVVWLLPWDKWMHLVGGIAIALIVHRAFRKETWPWHKLAAVVVFVTLGLGGLHEIVEWLGYGYLGAGDGFLFYGEGDFGEWRNSILDMAGNLAGALLVAGYARVK